MSLLKHLADVDNFMLPKGLENIFDFAGGGFIEKQILYHPLENPMSKEEATAILAGHTLREKVSFLHALGFCCAADSVFDLEEKVFIQQLVREVLGEDKIAPAIALVKNIIERQMLYVELGARENIQ